MRAAGRCQGDAKAKTQITHPPGQKDYDGDGNTKTEGSEGFQYDARSRLILAPGSAGYLWDGLNERIIKDGSTTFRYAWAATGINPTGRLLGEYSANGGANQETIVLDGSLPVGAAPNGGASSTAATMLRVYAGHLSEPRRITDASNNLRWSWDSDPFGVGTANNNPASKGIFNDDMRFPGQLFDSESATNYNLTRNYDFSRGRYLQSDTVGLVGGINTYTNAGNNPANNTDSIGTQEGAAQGFDSTGGEPVGFLQALFPAQVGVGIDAVGGDR